MTLIRWKKESLILFIGDFICFIAALWLTLFIRYPQDSSGLIFIEHIKPFSSIFLIWAMVFFIAGLYEKQTNALKNKLLPLIVKTQFINILIAIVFFYFLPFYSITPKVNLFIYIFLSAPLIVIWRTMLVDAVYVGRRENVLFIGDEPEVAELVGEINENENYKMKALTAKDFDNEILNEVPKSIFVIVTDLRKVGARAVNFNRLPELLFAGVKFVDIRDFYENVFKRIPLSSVNESWFLENVSGARKIVYDFLKRVMDIVVGIFLGAAMFLVYPFVYVAIKREDGGSVIFSQDRIGKDNKTMRIFKFRSMNVMDGGRWLTVSDARVTRVGRFLRRTRIDELPQAWNILRGDISLVGPRPDALDLGNSLKVEIPYYAMRNLIKSGLSGWAQTHQNLPPQSVTETRERLAYDFYYLKNRSFLLDLEIALKTIKTLLSRAGL